MSIDWDKALKKAREKDEEVKRSGKIANQVHEEPEAAAKADLIQSWSEGSQPKTWEESVRRAQNTPNEITPSLVAQYTGDKSSAKLYENAYKTTERRWEEVNTAPESYKTLDKQTMSDISAVAMGKEFEKVNSGAMGFVTAFADGMSGGHQYGTNAMYIDEGKRARERLRKQGYSDELIDAWANIKQNENTAIFDEQIQQEISETNPVLASAASVGLKMATTPADVLYMIDQAASGKIDTNNVINSALQIDDRIVESVSNDIAEKSKAGAWLYNVGMSGVNSLAASIMPGGFAMLGADAATSAMRRYTEKGLSTEKAFIGGIVAGVAEGFFEKVSIGSFKSLQSVSPAMVRDVLVNVAKSVGVNFSEEAFTELANVMWDTFVNGDLSDMNLLTQEYRNQGMTPEKAQTQAFVDLFVSQVFEAGLSGAVMGGAFGVGGSTIGYVANHGAIKSTGQQIKSVDGGVEASIDTAKTAPQKSRPYKVAEKAQKKLDKGKALSDWQAGLVATENIRYVKENAPQLEGAFVDARNAEDVERIYTEEKRNLESMPITPKSAVKELETQRTNALESLKRYSESGAKVMVEGKPVSAEDLVKTKMPTIGKTKDGKVISVSSVESVNDGVITVKTSEGTTQTLDTQALTGKAKELWSYAEKKFDNADAINAFVEGYYGGSINAYGSLFNQTYQLAQTGATMDVIRSEDSYAAMKLGDNAFTQAFNAGTKLANNKVGVLDVSTGLKTNSQKLTINMMDNFAKRHGLSIVVVDTLGGTEGKYKPSANQIVVALDASGGALNRVFGHETYHYLKQKNALQAKQIEDFVFDTMTKLKGKEWVDNFIDNTYDKETYKTEEARREEFVADQMFEVFANERAVKEFATKDASLLQKISAHVKSLIAEVKSILKKLVASGKYEDIAAWQEDLDSLQKLNDMVLDALANVEQTNKSQTAEFKSALSEVVAEDATPISTDEIITDGAVVTDGDGTYYSIRSMNHDIAEGKMFEDLEKYCGFTKEQTAELKNQLTDLVNYMTPHRDIVDLNETEGREDRKFSPYKPNSDPLYTISLDYSTQCSKRLLTQYVIEQLQLRENRPMSAEEQLAIRDMLKEYGKAEKGLEVACIMCYVEAARLKSPKQMNRWLSNPEPYLVKYFAKTNKEFNDSVKKAQAEFKISKGYDAKTAAKDMKSADKKAFDKLSNDLRAKYKPSAAERAIIETAKSLPNSTYLTSGNLANLSTTNPEIYKAYTSFIRSATRSKVLETDVAYYYGDSTRDNGNGIVVSDSFIESVNKENGMRFSSWSDWRIQHMLDWITAVIDNSVRGAAMHGYTKYADEVRVLGKTGMMFNLSGVTGTQTGLNEDGSLNFSDTESINIDEALELREELPETAGLQCIGVSTEHVFALLRSDIIDYVIPYHVSGLNAGLRRMGNIYGWNDFTQTQHAKTNKNASKENAVDPDNWHKEPVFSEFFVGYDTGLKGDEAMRKSAENYKRMCEERGLVPKFEEFSKEPNYWKLLIDRKMINQKTNTLIKQKPVTPNFDFGVIKGVVDKYVENYDSTLEQRALNHIVENWDSVPQRIKDLKKQGNAKAKQTKKAVDTLSNETLAAQPKEEAYLSTKRGAIQETKDLVAIHNITEQQLIDALQRNNLIASSIAVTNLGHTGFADLSLLFNKNTIDPVVNQENKLFGADAWTPTQTALKKSARFDGNKVSKTVSGIKSAIGSRYANELFDYTTRQFEDAIRKADGSIFTAFSNDIGMQTAYALEKGLISKVPTTRGVIDKTALKEQLDSKLHSDYSWREYKQWLNGISDSIIKDFNPATNEDILNNMKAQPLTAKPFKLMENGELVVPAAEYAGIEDLRSNKHRLSDKAEVETKKVASKLMSFANRLAKAKGIDSKTVINAINASFGDRYNTKDIAKTFDLNGVTITNAIARDIQTLYKEAVELPTPYFEAKPMREIGLDEVAVAIIPDTVSDELKSLLDEYGIKYQVYESGNDQARIRAINAVEEVKFSTKRSSSISEDASNYIASTEEFQEAISILGERFELAGKVTLSPKAIDRLAGRLLDKSKSNYSREQLTERLTALFDYIANSRDVSWEEITTIAANISKDMLKESSVLDRSMQKEYSDVLDLMKESKVYISPEVRQEIDYNFGSYEAFRRAMGNKLKVTVTDSSAVPLDVFWRELSEARPEMFDAEENALDMPSRLAEFFEMTAPQYVNPYDNVEMDMDEAAYDFALQMYDEYFNIPEIKTEARKYALKEERLRGKYNAKIKDIRKTYQDRIKTLRTEKNNKIEATKAYYREKHEAYREKRNETQDKQRLRASIVRTSKKLVEKLVKPTDTKYIPQELVKPVTGFCQMITDTGVFDYEKADKLREAYQNIINGKIGESLESVTDEVTIQDLETAKKLLKGKQLSQLNVDELRLLRNITKDLHHLVTTTNKMFNENIREGVVETGENIISEIGQFNERRKNKRFDSKRFATEAQRGLIKPATFFDLVETPTLQKLYQNVRNGESEWYRTASDIKSKLASLQEQYGYEDWKNEVVGITRERGGNKIYFTMEEALSIYATAKREQGLKHLLADGFVRQEEEYKKIYKALKKEYRKNSSMETPQDIIKAMKGNAVTLTAKDIASINSAIDKISTNAKKYADGFVSYMSKDMADLGNKTAVKLKGRKIFGESYYFPIVSDPNHLNFSAAKGVDARIKNMSATKATVENASNAIVIGSFTDTSVKHCLDMAMYSSFTLPLEDFTRAYNYKVKSTAVSDSTSVRQSLEKAFGSGAHKYISQLLTDINGGVVQKGAGVINKLITISKRDAVMGSLSVAIQQPSAIGRALAYIDFGNFFELKKPNIKNEWAELKKYAPVAGVKEMGYFDTNIGKSALDWVTDGSTKDSVTFGDKLVNARDKTVDVLSRLPSKMDEVTWVKIWNAVKKETAKNNPKMDRTSEEFLKLAGERFTYVIDRTQVYDSVFARSEWMRAKDSGIKQVMSFMNEPLVSLNMLYEATVMKREDKAKFVVRTMTSVFVAMALNSALKAVIQTMRDDDDETTPWEQWLANLVDNFVYEPLGWVPFIGDLLERYKTGIDGTNMHESALTSIADSLLVWFDDKKSTYQKLKTTCSGIGLLTGLPVKNVWREFEAMKNAFKATIIGTENMWGDQLQVAEKLAEVDWLFGDDGVFFTEADKKLFAEGGSKTTARGVGFAIHNKVEWEDLKFTKDLNVADQAVIAYFEGDQTHADRMLAQLLRKKGDQDEVESTIRTAVKNRYLESDITKDEVEDILVNLVGDDEEDILWKIEEWDGGTDWTKYGDFYDAIDSGENLKSVIKEYTDKGVEKKTLASRITSNYKKQYVELYKTDKRAASKMKTKLVEAYAALGYKRSDKSKDIDAWLKPKKEK